MSHLKWVLVAVLALRVLALHGINLTYAGGLWRDEANTVAVASLPSLSDIWHALPFESFPLLPFLLVRWWVSLFGPGDATLRMLGMLIGLGTFEILWRIAREAGSRTPVLSLTLLGLNTMVIRWGDSLRGYGLGMVFILLTFHLVWRVAESPSRRRIIGATLVAILSVQTLYSNAFLIAAICLGGCAVCALERQWKRAAMIIGIGAAAAVSLWPYHNIINQAKEVNLSHQIQFDAGWIWSMLDAELGSPLPWIKWIWVGLWLLTLVAGIYFCVWKHRFKGRPARQSLYSFIILSSSTLAFLIFVLMAHLPTSPWYYLTLMAVWTGCMEMMRGVMSVRQEEPVMATTAANVPEKKSRLYLKTAIQLIIGTTVLAAALFLPTARDVKVRMTNLDLIGAALQKTAQKEDLIIVHPWFNGISFNRYYSGPANWITIPPMATQSIHRFDLLRAQIMQPDLAAPMRPVLDKCAQTLRAGHHVWVVGHLPPGSPEFEKKARAFYLKNPKIWETGSAVFGSYETMWAGQLSSLLRAHSGHTSILYPLTNQEISPMEFLEVFRVDGWREK